MIYLRLFWEFFKTGLCAVGGGMSTVPFLVDIGNRTGWFTASELANMIAVGESTPGPIGVNMATYVGYTVKGIGGSLVATYGLVLPSLIVILIIAAFLKEFDQKPIVITIFYFLRAVVVGLLVYALYSVLKLTVIKQGNLNLVRTALFIVFILITNRFSKIHPVVWILIGSIVGIFLP